MRLFLAKQLNRISNLIFTIKFYLITSVTLRRLNEMFVYLEDLEIDEAVPVQSGLKTIKFKTSACNVMVYDGDITVAINWTRSGGLVLQQRIGSGSFDEVCRVSAQRLENGPWVLTVNALSKVNFSTLEEQL